MLLKTLASSVFYARFARSFSALGFRRAQATWPSTSLDLTGQTWLVTGASAGLGLAVARQANQAGARVVAVARNAQALESLQSDMPHPKQCQIMTASLDSMAAIQALVKTLTSSGFIVDVLVNNVGVLLNRWTVTDEGFETALATNLLGPVLLTEGLVRTGALPASGVVINVSSGGMYGTPLRIDEMATPTKEDYDGVSAYAMHKRGQVTWTHQWNRDHPNGPVSYVMHPGWVDTPGVKSSLPQFRALFQHILRTPEQGADTILWLGSERPMPPKEGIWLDRSNQPEHAFGFTKKTKVTPQALQTYLEATLSPWL